MVGQNGCRYHARVSNWSPNLAGRCQASVFADFRPLGRDQEAQSSIAHAAEQVGLTRLPIAPPGSLMLFISSADARLVVALSDERLDFSLNAFQSADREIKDDSLDRFAERAVPVLQAVLRTTGRSGHRIAFIAEEFATTAVPRPSTTADVATTLLRLPTGWGPTSLIEWTWKYARSLTNDGERFNVLSTVQASKGDVSGLRFDGVWFQTDVNTPQERAALRYTPDSLDNDFAQLVRICRDTRMEVIELMGDE